MIGVEFRQFLVDSWRARIDNTCTFQIRPEKSNRPRECVVTHVETGQRNRLVAVQ
jgi:hypothetical protein